jgi:hypothetical protein
MPEKTAASYNNLTEPYQKRNFSWTQVKTICKDHILDIM